MSQADIGPKTIRTSLFWAKTSHSQIPALEKVALALAASRETAAAANLHIWHDAY